jgi:two-component system, OmpR family, response regulator MprA
VETILLVENDEAFRYAVRVGLEAAGYRVLTAEGSMAALQIAAAHQPDIVVADVRLVPGEPHGLSLGSMLRHQRPSLPIIYITAYPELADKVREYGTLLMKPIELDALVTAVQAELGRSQ